MPCPEQQAWGGVLKRRLLLVYGSQAWLPRRLRRLLLPLPLAYTTISYRRLARRVARQIADYRACGATVVAVIGVDGSPSCGLTHSLDLPAAADRLAGIDPATITSGAMTTIVADSLRPGWGLFTAALHDELTHRGITITHLAHDLLAELDGSPSPVAEALRPRAT
jgi:hypothetical protein